MWDESPKMRGIQTGRLTISTLKFPEIIRRLKLGTPKNWVVLCKDTKICCPENLKHVTRPSRAREWRFDLLQRCLEDGE